MSWTHEYKTTKQWNWCISWCISCLCLSLSSSNMARYRQLTNVHRRQIINLKRRNITNGRISIQLDCTVRTVQRVWSWYRNTRSSDKLPLPGRPRKTTGREDRCLILMSRLSRFSNACQLTVQWNAFSNKNVSVKTARRYLHAQRVYSRIARLKPLISVRNRQRRVTWAYRNRNWTVHDNWSYIVFPMSLALVWQVMTDGSDVGEQLAKPLNQVHWTSEPGTAYPSWCGAASASMAWVNW